MKVFELTPINGRKSFYGKAVAIEKDDGTIELKSYNTIVAKIVNGEFKRWPAAPWILIVLLRSVCTARMVFTSRTLVLAAPHGHVSVLRQRASATTT